MFLYQVYFDTLFNIVLSLKLNVRFLSHTFSISEPAPVRLASLRAERGLAHWSGALEIIQSGHNRDAADHLRQDSNKMQTRSRFKKENFFI